MTARMHAPPNPIALARIEYHDIFGASRCFDPNNNLDDTIVRLPAKLCAPISFYL
jgi:hypothetical protein